MSLRLQFIKPVPELKPYITQLWIYESNAGFADQGTLIAPNARPKVIIPYESSLITTDNIKTAICKEGDICFIGIRDVPVRLSTSGKNTGSIGIEFTTAGAYKFLNISMYEFTNNLFSFSDIFGKPGNSIQQLIQDHEDPRKKIELIQEFLLKQLARNKRNNLIVDHSIKLIRESNGLLEIKELTRKTGYSKRYLDMLFENFIGISPKLFASIQRFQSLYKSNQGKDLSLVSKEKMYELYYDQSHFIKEFKRYTGFTPKKFSKLKNDFGKHF